MREAVIAYWFGRSRCPHPFKATGATRVPPARPFRERAGDDGVPPVLCRGKMPLRRRSRQSPRICRCSPRPDRGNRSRGFAGLRTNLRAGRPRRLHPMVEVRARGGLAPRRSGQHDRSFARSSGGSHRLCRPMPPGRARHFRQPNNSQEALAMRRRRITAAAACFPAPAHAWVPGRRAAAGDRPIPRAGDPPARPSGDASVRKPPAARGAARRLARPNSLP